MTILAQKIGMKRVFDTEGNFLVVSIVSLLKSEVVGNKIEKRDGYDASMIKAFVGKKEILFESRDAEGRRENAQLKAGDLVQVQSRSKGKGFSGVIKRHKFSRGPVTHGSDHHRKPGSIGSMYPQRVVKGKKMPGRLGGGKVTVKNLRVIEVDEKNSIALITGAIPGPNGSIQRIEIM